MILDGKKELFRWKVDAYPALLFCPAESMLQEAIDTFGQTWPATVVTFQGTDAYWWANQDTINEHGKVIYERWKDDFNRLKKEYSDRVEALRSITAKVMAAPSLELWDAFFEAYRCFWMAGTTWETMTYGTTDLLLAALDKTDDIQVLTQFPERSFHLEEEYSLVKAVSTLGKTLEEARAHPDFKQMVEQHAKEFRWIQNGYHGVRPSPVKFFIERLQGLDLIEACERLEKYPGKNKEAIARVEASYSDEVKRLASAVRLSVYFQDHRKMEAIKAIEAATLLYELVAEKLGWTLEESLFFSHQEVRDLDGKRDELERRQRYCVIIMDNKEISISSERAREIYEELEEANAAQHKGEMKGIIGNSGKARGEVRVITSLQGQVDFPEGKVLVSIMTSPDYVVIMRKAAAIVTDEGGLTCHAAIVSRELGIPCIVGTKTATKTFKDGDLVEVDATKGTVTRL